MQSLTFTKSFFALLLLASLSSACGGGKKSSKNNEPQFKLPVKNEDAALKIKNKFDQLAYILEGSFSSEKQHKASPLEYYHVTLHVYQIWKERTDGKWFYLEQALATLPNEPYRQRIYQLKQVTPDTFVNANYLIPNKEKYIGAWKTLMGKGKPDPFADLKVSDLEKKDGCDVTLAWAANGTYTGKTQDGTCQPTDRKDADYVITEVYMGFAGLSTWDRGMNKAGERVWGAAKKSYMFDRMTDERILSLLQPPPTQ